MIPYSIIVPAFNEEDVIGDVLKDLGSPEGCQEIIVVDDGSTDRTAELAESFGARVLRHPYNKGYGASIKTGILSAENEVAIIFDSDGQHKKEDLLKIAECAGEYDMVAGVRGADSHSVWLRRPGKWILGLVANYLTRHKIPDLNCGLRSFKTAVIKKYLHLMPNNFSLSTTSTIAMFRMGYSVRFVPVKVLPRRGAKSTVKFFEDGLRTLMLIINLSVLFAPMRVFLPLSFFFVFSSLIYFIWLSLFVEVYFTPSMVMLFVTGVLIFFMGIICEQVSSIRRELYQDR